MLCLPSIMADRETENRRERERETENGGTNGILKPQKSVWNPSGTRGAASDGCRKKEKNEEQSNGCR